MTRPPMRSLIAAFIVPALGCGSGARSTSAPPPSSTIVAPPPPAFGGTDGEITARRLVVGESFTCVLRDDRSVWCWGQLPAASAASAASAVPALAGAVELASDDGRVCARDGRGRVRCLAPLADGDSASLGDEGALAIAVAGRAVCATLAGGSLRCAGLYETQARTASEVHDALDVASITGRLCVVRREHLALCFGADSDYAQEIDDTMGAASLGDVGGRPCPIDTSGHTICASDRFAPPDGLVALDGAGARFCALTAQREAFCLDGAFTRVSASAIAMASRDDHQCVLDRDGTVRCRGEDHLGQVSGRVPTPRGVATRVLGLASMVDLAVSGARACAIDQSGALFCWTSASTEAARVEAPPLTALAGARLALCGLTSRGRVHCFDHDTFAPLGELRAASIGDGSANLLVSTTIDGTPALLFAWADEPSLTPVRALRGASDVRAARFPRGLCGVLRGRVACVSLEDVELEASPLEGVVRLWGDGHVMLAIVDGGARAWGEVQPLAASASGWVAAASPLAADDLADTDALFLDGVVTRVARDGTVSRRVDGGWQRVTGLASIGRPRRVAAVGGDGCALADDGAIWCWGENERADGRAREPTSWAPVELPAIAAR